MTKNKIITSQGNVQFINSKGKTINVHPWHVYSVYEGDTVSFLFVGMKEYSGQAIFASQFEDLEVNGVTYDNMEDLKNAISEAFAHAGAQARCEIVTELPSDPYTNTIYLVKKEHGDGYDEYIWNEAESEWELIGDTDIEFERYLQITDFNVYSAATSSKLNYISGAVDTNAADIVSLSGAIDTEIAAREAADSFISGAVDTLSANLSNEVSRATSAEVALGNRIDSANARIDAEQVARANADTALSGAIDTVAANLASETSAREAADATLDGKIDAETSAREAADTALSGAIDTVAADLATEAQRALNAEGALDTKIGAVSGAVDAEVSAREAADATLDGKIDAEETRALGVEATKADKADAVASAEYISSSSTINFKNISGNVISSIDASDFVIDGMVDDVKVENGYLKVIFNTDSGKEEIDIPLTDIFNPNNYYDKTAVDGIVSGINEDIDDEVSARTAADAVLQSNIDTVSGNVETEAARAESAETALQTAIDNEATARANADTALQGSIDVVSGNVETEASAREAADTAISGAVDSVAGDLADEVSAREAADTALDTKIDTKADSSALTEAISTLEGEISGIDDSLSAYSTSAEVTAEINAAVSGKADSNAVYTKQEVDNAITAATDDMATMTWVENKHYITGVDLSDYATEEYVDAAVSGKADVTLVNTKADLSALTEDERVWGESLNDINTRINTISGNAVSSGEVQTQINNSISGKANSSDVYTKSETSGATEIATALNAKQDTLSEGTNITISGNVISAEDNYISGVTVVDNSTPMPSVAQDKVKVIWADGYKATYDVDYEGSIGDNDEHIYANFVRLEFGNMTKTVNSNFTVSSDDCYALSAVTFNGNVMFEGSFFASAYLMEEIYFFADSPNVSMNDDYSKFLTTVYDGCETYETSAATYPIYVANLANYENAVLYNDGNQDITWGQHFGNRLQQIPNGGKNVVFSYNTDKADITLPTSAITNGYATTNEVETVVDQVATNTTALGGLSLVKLSQSEYDALTTKNNNTLYIIT